MSDFKNVSDFRKGSYRSYPYQDPTYLSFAILFDAYNPEHSPLLAGPAEEYLTELSTQDAFYAERLQDFQQFKKALFTINNEMPWYWQSLKGLERFFAHDPSDAYLGGDDAKLEIETLESLNLPIAGLMHLYRKAVFDERKWCYILPKNLRQFAMYVYVTEVRSIQFNKETDKAIIGDTGRPYFMVGIHYCQFDMTTGTNIFSELSKSPEGPATNNITITYEHYDKIEARVLNGIIEEPNYAKSYISPAPDNEFLDANSTPPVNSEGVSSPDVAAKKQSRFDKLQDKAKQSVKGLANDKRRELEQEIRNKTVNRIPSFENVFSNLIRKIDNATDVQQLAKNLGNVIPSNISGVASGNTIQQALNKGAAKGVQNLGNVYK